VIQKDTDLQKNDIIKVSKKIPIFYTNTLGELDIELKKHNDLQFEFEKEMKKQIDICLHDKDFNLFTALKTKEDRDIFLLNSSENIMRIRKSIAECKAKMTAMENILNYLKQLQTNINTIVQFEKFRSGN
jgi:hypothetical protein